MSFSRSRGKLYGQEDLAITFDDVAGIDEAVEEVREIVEFLQEPKKFQALGARIRLESGDIVAENRRVCPRFGSFARIRISCCLNPRSSKQSASSITSGFRCDISRMTSAAAGSCVADRVSGCSMKMVC